MRNYEEFGFLDNPRNGLGIVRARTLTGNLRSWEIPRSEEALSQVIREIGSSPIPGLYLLFDGKKVYIGQTEDLQRRLQQHMKAPDKKIRNWNRAILINDGRNSTQSDFNDENIRLALENHLVQTFKINGYEVTTSSTRSPTLSATQKVWVTVFKKEIFILLSKKSYITKEVRGRIDDEVFNDDARKIVETKFGKNKVEQWGKKEAIIEGEKAFLRPGSSKKKGWQITFRGSSKGSFKASLEEGRGWLLVPRGPVLLIPLVIIKKFLLIVDKGALGRNTVDVFIRFDDDRITLVYKKEEIDITGYALRPYP